MTPIAPRWTAILGLMLMTRVGCSSKPRKPDQPMSSETKASNPLLGVWTGPWGGVPPFGRFKGSDLKPALEAAMAENLAEIDRIAAQPAAATFDNTIAEMERSGHDLNRVHSIY